MKLILSLLSLRTTAGGLFAGVLQQNLSQAEKPEIDILFEEIVRKMKNFSKENPISRGDLKEIKCVESQGEAKNDCKERIGKSIVEINNESDHDDKLSKYTFNVLTAIWVGLLSNYIIQWYEKNTGLGDPTKSNLEIMKEFTEENKEKSFKEAEKSVVKEKEEFEKKFENKPKTKEAIEKIYWKIKDFIFLIELPKNYNHSSNNDSPYEHHIKGLEWEKINF